MYTSGNGFADAFRDAVSRSGMTLVEIVDALAERGVHITQATLSYWQSGRSLPRRQSSLKALSEIEDVLGVEAGCLARSLDEGVADDTLTGRPVRTMYSSSVPGVLWGAPTSLDPRLIDWSEEVQRKFMHCSVTIRDGGHSVVVRTETVVRISSLYHPTLHTCLSWEHGDEPPVLSDVYGGEVGDTMTDEEHCFQLIPIHLTNIEQLGELHQIGYTSHSVSSRPVTAMNIRWFSWPLDMFALAVDFGDHVPARVEWVTVETRPSVVGNARVEIARELDVVNGVCQATIDNVSDEASFMRWFW